MLIVVSVVPKMRPGLERFVVFFGVNFLFIEVIMQGEYCNSSVIEVVEEDFVETPGRDPIMEMLYDPEGMCEGRFIGNLCVGRAILFEDVDRTSSVIRGGLFKLVRVCVVVRIKEVPEDGGRHGDSPQASENTRERAIIGLFEWPVGHKSSNGSAVGTGAKTFEEQRAEMVEREHKRVKIIRESVRGQSPSMDARSVLGAKFLVGGQDGVDI